MSKINYIKLIEEAEEVRIEEVRTVEIENTIDFYNHIMEHYNVFEFIRELSRKNIDLYFKDKNIHTIHPCGDIYLSIIIALIENEIVARKERRKKRDV